MKKKVLLFGGSSAERLVSVASAQNLADQVPFDEHWFLSEVGEIYRVEKESLLKHQKPFEKPFVPQGAKWAKSLEEAKNAVQDRVVFIALHGTEGEDGKIQGFFEEHRVPFTGSGSQSSAWCFNKATAKDKVKHLKVRVCEGQVLQPGKALTEKGTYAELLGRHQRLVFKPLANGSSVGLRFVGSATELEQALQDIRKAEWGDYLVEPFVTGRELTVGVIQEGAALRALPPSEVLLEKGRSFDYEGKYLGKGTVEVTPADLSPQEQALAKETALQVHRALGCYGYSRTDFILDPQGALWFLETNTLPGLTRASFIPQQLAAEQISFSVFVQNQLALAESRYS